MAKPLGEILRTLSHELKNPLGAVNVATAVLLRRHDDPATRRQLEIIQRSAEKMTRVIEALIDGARESG